MWNTRGVAGNTYYHENICKSLPRDVDVGYSPFASLFRTTFFHLQSPCHPAPFPPLAFTGRAASHRIYGTYGGRYVLWLIVLLSLTYFQFTAAARRFASWLSIVRDERRFMCHPGLYLGLRPPRVLSRRRFVVSDMISGISSWQKNLCCRIGPWKNNTYYLLRVIKMLLIACLFHQHSLLLRALGFNSIKITKT